MINLAWIDYSQVNRGINRGTRRRSKRATGNNLTMFLETCCGHKVTVEATWRKKPCRMHKRFNSREQTAYMFFKPIAWSVVSRFENDAFTSAEFEYRDKEMDDCQYVEQSPSG